MKEELEFAIVMAAIFAQGERTIDDPSWKESSRKARLEWEKKAEDLGFKILDYCISAQA